ncbi:rhodanese-like domain-containing protein [Pseudomonas sp. Marseille-Q0931]|uniref:rhodanese-like domain-containing protein n=1 Tax=Pseudomonas sp. Marseille-Q0931 TaxID=2697507 RepID=UPI0023B90114|nr:rhodanese-like domain-containing protein [Pseudomonas sp. Marseille-Q0931]
MERISIRELAEWQAAGRSFELLDVRRAIVRNADGAQIANAKWQDPELLFSWKDQVPRDRPVILYCAHGHEISQGSAATLWAMGLDARYLVDGFAGWREAKQPVCDLV